MTDEKRDPYKECPCDAHAVEMGNGTCRCGLRWSYNYGIEAWVKPG